MGKNYQKFFFITLSKPKKGGGQNYNIRAPYVLLFTNRLVTNPSGAVKRKIALGHPYGVCDPLEYKNNRTVQSSWELGAIRAAKILARFEYFGFNPKRISCSSFKRCL